MKAIYVKGNFKNGTRWRTTIRYGHFFTSYASLLKETIEDLDKEFKDFEITQIIKI